MEKKDDSLKITFSQNSEKDDIRKSEDGKYFLDTNSAKLTDVEKKPVDGEISMIIFKNGTEHKFTGTYSNGSPQKGTYVEPGSYVFEGLFNSEGGPFYGEIKYEDGDIFKGSLRDGMPYSGKISFKNGDIFKGTLVSSLTREGAKIVSAGTMLYKNGNIFKGVLLNGKMYEGGLYNQNKPEVITKISNDGKIVYKRLTTDEDRNKYKIEDTKQYTGLTEWIDEEEKNIYLLSAPEARNDDTNYIEPETGKIKGTMAIWNEDFTEKYCLIEYKNNVPINVKNANNCSFLQKPTLRCLKEKVGEKFFDEVSCGGKKITETQFQEDEKNVEKEIQSKNNETTKFSIPKDEKENKK